MPVSAEPLSLPGVPLDGEVAAMDSRIDADSRTLRVRARLDNSGDRLRAGMAFAITLRFPGDSFAAVDPLAIQWGADGAYVWTGVEGRAAAGAGPDRPAQRRRGARRRRAAAGDAGGDRGRADAAARRAAAPSRATRRRGSPRPSRRAG